MRNDHKCVVVEKLSENSKVGTDSSVTRCSEFPFNVLSDHLFCFHFESRLICLINTFSVSLLALYYLYGRVKVAILNDLLGDRHTQQVTPRERDFVKMENVIDTFTVDQK